MASPTPFLYRKLLILAINLVVIIWLIHETYSPAGPSDVFGIFLIAVIVLLLFYNLYAFLLAKFFFGKDRIRLYIEAIFIFLLALPILGLYYFTR